MAIGAGWWWLSAPDPERRADGRWEHSRLTVRVSALGVVAGLGAGIALWAGTLTYYTVSQRGSAALAGVGAAAGTITLLLGLISYLVCLFASLVYLQALARRIPSESIERRAKQLFWLVPIGAGASVVGYAGGVLMSRMLHVLTFTGVAILLVCWIGYLLLVNTVRRELKQAKSEARAVREESVAPGVMAS